MNDAASATVAKVSGSISGTSSLLATRAEDGMVRARKTEVSNGKTREAASLRFSG